MSGASFLPGTGRWQLRQQLTEGAGLYAQRSWPSPSTILRMVPLPGTGKIS